MHQASYCGGPSLVCLALHIDPMNRGLRTHREPHLSKLLIFHRAVAAAGVDATISQRMENLYEVDTSLAERLQAKAEEICKTRCVPEAMPKPTGSDWREPLVPLLQDWFKALKAVDAGHRAAGLLAANSLLTAFGSIRPGDHFGTVQSSTAEQSKLRSALQELGATFEPGYADGFYGYSGNWLDQAKDLDLDSEGGRLALVTWMSSGAHCDQAGSEPFRKVITEGEGSASQKHRCTDRGSGSLHGRGRLFGHRGDRRRGVGVLTVNTTQVNLKVRPRLIEPKRLLTIAPA